MLPQKGEVSGFGDKGNENNPKGASCHPGKDSRETEATAVYFEVVNDKVEVRPVRDAAGSLSEYAWNFKPDSSIKQMKDRAWEEALHEKTSEKSA